MSVTKKRARDMKEKVVKLNKWQRSVWGDPSRYLILNCGRRAGKSTFAALKMAEFVQKNPNSIVYYVSPSYRQSKSIMWNILRDYIPSHWVVKSNETELTLWMANGSRIELKGADADPHSLRGVRVDFLVGDEVAYFRNWKTVWYDVLRPTLIDSEGKAILISTPQGFNFWYELYNVDDTDYSSYTFSSYDNEYIPRTELDKLKGQYDEETFQQEIMARFVRVSGMVYKEWDINSLFKQIPYDENLPVHVTIDYGVNDPTAIIWLQKHGSELRAIDYYEKANSDIAHHAQVINSKPYHTPELITADPYSGNARNMTTNTTPNDEFAKHGIHIRSPRKLDIPNQIRVAHKYMKNLYVDKSLERLRDCILNYRYPEKKENILDQSNEKPIHDEYSHAMRALEYYFLAIDEGIGKDITDIIAELPREDYFDSEGFY